ncbi:zinc finger Ran-binding domain-containing family 2 protein [candidate division WOR-3 bacterium]|nr:zinc finger Ran-binding domain-containing family 2 protein [candidate division WOR-3 bacterium]
MEFTIFVIIIYALWFVEVIALYLLYIFFLWEDFYFGQLFEDTRLFIALFCVIIVFVLAIFSDIPGVGIIAFLALLGFPYAINSLSVEEGELKERRISKDNEEIRNILKYLEKEGADVGLYMRLGYLYKDLGDVRNALKSFKKARELTNEDVLTVTEREIKSLEHQINEEESKKTHICKHCGAKNYPTRIFCVKCKKLLETSVVEYFKRLFKNTLKATPIVIALVFILVVSGLMFWLYLGFFENLLFYGLFSSNVFMFIRKAIKEKYAYR